MLEGRGLSFRYGRGQKLIDGFDITVAPGEIVGLAGASGRGKSTVGRLLARHLKPNAGAVLLDGVAERACVDPVQYLPQSPGSGVDPRWRIGRIIAEGWTPDERTRKALGVERDWCDRYPHEISGGQLQRVAILRALGPQTRYLIADEITAMLDPLSQAAVWTFLLARCAERGMGMVVISHDRALLARVTQRQVAL